MLIEYAFDIRDFQIQGGPNWIGETLYDVTALPPDDSQSRQLKPKYVNDPPSDEQRQMLKSLLISRFALKFHMAKKEGPVYFLVRGTKPLQMQETKHKDYFPMLAIGGRGNGAMTGQAVPMSYFATRLSLYLERPVIDETGIKGVFDFQLDQPLDDSHEVSEAEFLAGVIDSVSQLGLKLKTGKSSVDSIVIDSANKATYN